MPNIIIMDLDSLPACAMFRNVGTVPVRLRRDERGACCRGTRTRSDSEHCSDCDSDVGTSRPYSCSTARSRYVNVCAAVCLLLLVGGLSPQCSAAPHRSRNMDRQRRAVDSKSREMWENPCDYTSNTDGNSLNVKELAQKLSLEAKNAVTKASNYKDVFANKLHSYQSFEELAKMFETYEWLRKLPSYREEVLPKDKVLGAQVSANYVDQLMGKMNSVMPAMYKSLKTAVAGLYVFANEGLNANIVADETLKGNITKTMHDTRAVLCFLSDIMKAKNLATEPLPDSDIPDFSNEDTGILVYRDTMNYLEYLSQVFQKYSETQ